MQIENEILYVGDTWDFIESFSDYPSTAYDVTLYLQMPGGLAVNNAGSASDNDFQFVFTASQTAQLTSGTYKYSYVATKKSDSTVKTIASGFKTILAKQSAASSEIIFWTNRITALQTAYEEWCERGFAEISIPGGNSLKYNDGDVILKHLENAKQRVKSLQRKESGKSNANKHRFRFSY